jgi:hypothetical protein
MFAHPRTLSGLLLVFTVSCQSIWEDLTRPNEMNCIPNPGLCVAPLVCDQQTGGCVDPSCVPNGCADLPAPVADMTNQGGGDGGLKPADLGADMATSFPTLWAVGASGTVLRRYNLIWNNLSISTTMPFNGVWGTSATDAWVVGGGGELQHYNGSGWSPVSGYTQDLYAVWGSTTSNVWVVGNGGTILQYDGIKWTSITSCLTNQDLRGVWGTAGMVWAVGANGTVCACVGTSCSTESTTGCGFNMQSVFGTSTSDVWAVGSSANACHRTTNGWSSVSLTGASATYGGIWGSSANNLWAVSSPAGTRQWLGSGSWSIGPTPSVALSSVWGTASNSIWFAGTGGTVLFFNGLGFNPETKYTTNDLNDIYAIP